MHITTFHPRYRNIDLCCTWLSCQTFVHCAMLIGSQALGQISSLLAQDSASLAF
jgi:hypothetical protein